jgi:hypothetical protein
MHTKKVKETNQQENVETGESAQDQCILKTREPGLQACSI